MKDIKTYISESSNDEFKPDGFRTVSNGGGYEIEISNFGDSARFRFYGGEPTDWLEIEYDEDGEAYVETERGREMLSDYTKF